MAYETGTATDANDLLSKLRTFVAANGWSEDNYGARTSGSGNALQINKGGFYVTFRTDTTSGTASDPGPFMGCYAHNTYSGGNGTESQAGASAFMMANAMSGPFTAYHFMSGTEKGSEFLHVIVETVAGLFKHFGTGTLVKMGAITNGQFAHACRWNYAVAAVDVADDSRHAVPFDSRESSGVRAGPSLNVRADAESVSPRWLESSSATAARGIKCGVRSAATGSTAQGSNILMVNGASALTGRAMLFPCFLYGERTGGLFNPLGYPPGIRWVNLTLLEPNTVLTIGSDQWKVFPVVRKNGSAGQPNSGTFGYAYKVA